MGPYNNLVGNDPWLERLRAVDPSVVAVPFNPTAEHMAQHLLNVVGPELLDYASVELIRVQIDETRKCSAAVELDLAKPDRQPPKRKAQVREEMFAD